MRLGASDVRLGGQGWSEPDWNGVFYPRGLKTGARLASYASAFDFVEIDSTFYASPRPRRSANGATACRRRSGLPRRCRRRSPTILTR